MKRKGRDCSGNIDFHVGDLVEIVDKRHPELVGYVGLVTHVQNDERHENSYCNIWLSLPHDHRHAHNTNFTDSVWAQMHIRRIDTIVVGFKK